jgi:hypothetical protein
MTIVAWQKLYNITNSCLFFGIANSGENGTRGFSMHTPWSDNVVYFDTGGAWPKYRINAPIDTLPDYKTFGMTSDWWTNWHHFVFQKNRSTKEVWIDGVLFLTGYNSDPLLTDFTKA